MLARRIPTLLPPLPVEEALNLTKLYSAAGFFKERETLFKTRPFRAPHYSISPVALLGGGSWPKPGEVSLAHEGVLFLDEFPEFRRDVIEALRTPLEEGTITIARAKSQVTFPASVSLVAAMNPCPCGFLSDPHRNCRCTLPQIQKYQMKVSGPILDRIDLHVEVPSQNYGTLTQKETAESSSAIRKRILACRRLQAERFKNSPIQINARMRTREIKTFASLSSESNELLEAAMKELRLSARAYYKILKIARTIADLGSSEDIEAPHLAEALQYRALDRQWWG